VEIWETTFWHTIVTYLGVCIGMMLQGQIEIGRVVEERGWGIEGDACQLADELSSLHSLVGNVALTGKSSRDIRQLCIGSWREQIVAKIGG
jgi:hypothetical protein